MVLLQFLEIIDIFGDYLRVEYLCHAFIMPSTKRNGMRSSLSATIARPVYGPKYRFSGL